MMTLKDALIFAKEYQSNPYGDGITKDALDVLAKSVRLYREALEYYAKRSTDRLNFPGVAERALAGGS